MVGDPEEEGDLRLQGVQLADGVGGGEHHQLGRKQKFLYEGFARALKGFYICTTLSIPWGKLWCADRRRNVIYALRREIAGVEGR